LFSTFELRDKITPQSTDAQVVTVLKSELQSAIDNSFNVLRTRIDRFGVVSPNIQRLQTAGRILVELPGVKEPERVRRLLQGSANLEFWETFNLPEVYQSLVSVDAYLATLQKNTSDTAATTEATAQTETAKADTAATDSDLLSQLASDSTATNEEQTLEQFTKEHPLFGRLSLAQYNGQLSSGPVVGMARASDMAIIDSLLNLRQVKELLPRNLSLKWGVKAIDENSLYYQLYAIKVTNRDGAPALGGNVVTDATADFAQGGLGNRNEQEVSMTMNAEGAQAWARLTKDNIGKSVAIVLDNMVYSAPTVNTEIPGGRSQITGNFTPEEAKDLANVL
jgi:SecD/SecF fusion protein